MAEDVQTILRALVTRYVRLRGPITQATVRQVHAAHMRKNGRTVMVVATPLLMAINHDRWCGLCRCRSGVTAGQGWTEARCFGCGAVYPHVIWPEAADLPHITRALGRRPDPATRNWDPGQHWASLVAENARHGHVLGVSQ